MGVFESEKSLELGERSLEIGGEGGGVVVRQTKTNLQQY